MQYVERSQGRKYEDLIPDKVEQRDWKKGSDILSNRREKMDMVGAVEDVTDLSTDVVKEFHD